MDHPSANAQLYQVYFRKKKTTARPGTKAAAAVAAAAEAAGPSPTAPNERAARFYLLPNGYSDTAAQL